MSDEKDLERANELFEFLQGRLPEGICVPKSHKPKLTAAQAWTVIWHLGNEYWQVPDTIQRCGVCGDLFDSWRQGRTLDYGKAPYSFCDNCVDGEAFTKKMRRNPDAEERKEYFRP